MSTVRQMQPSLTPGEISDFAAQWYRKLDVHAPMVEVLPFLADDDLVMKFPEMTANGWAGFESWYQRVIRIFFDEVHAVKECTPKISGNEAEVHVVVQWEASVWNPPSATSARIKLDADQTWKVRRSDRTGGLEITLYTVNGLNYHPGSAKL